MTKSVSTPTWYGRTSLISAIWEGTLPGDHEWLPVALELKAPVTEFAAVLTDKNRKCEWQGSDGWIWLSPLYSQPPHDLAETRYCTARVRRKFFQELNTSLKEWVSRFELGLVLLSAIEFAPQPNSDSAHRPDKRDARTQMEQESVSAPETAMSGGPVIVGIIDTGLAFAHEQFREPGGTKTRLDCFWNQDETSITDQRGGRKAPYPGFGLELSKQDIDNLLAACTANGAVDEVAVYHAARNMQVARSFSHGTAVMYLACGENPSKARSMPRIMGVQLSRSTKADDSRRSLAIYALDAMRYILDRVGSRPVVINFSYAPFGGPHDGRSILEKAMDDLIDRRNAQRGGSKLSIVLPAGNGYLERCHAKLSLASGNATSHVTWRTLPDDETSSFLEIWIPAASSPAVSVSVVSPSGDESEQIAAGSVYKWQPGGHSHCVVAYSKRPVTEGGCCLVLVAVAPTVASTHAAVAPAGRWTIKITNRNETAMAINAWILRDDSRIGDSPRGRQSRFEDAAYQRYDAGGRLVEDDNCSYIKREGSMSGIATGAKTIVVGGYRGDSRAVAWYSGAGPVPSRNGPDALAVSERSVACAGVMAVGTRSGSHAAMNGTSVAAPFVTRMVASLMSAGKPAGPDDLRGIASDRDPDPEPPPGEGAPPNIPPGGPRPKPRPERGGGGRL